MYITWPSRNVTSLWTTWTEAAQHLECWKQTSCVGKMSWKFWEIFTPLWRILEVSWNGGTSRYSIWIGSSTINTINHLFLGVPMYGNTHLTCMCVRGLHKYLQKWDGLEWPSHKNSDDLGVPLFQEKINIYIYIHTGWWFGTSILFSHILGC